MLKITWLRDCYYHTYQMDSVITSHDKLFITHFYWKMVDKHFPNDFCIISNDCWGGEFYKNTNRPFNTPFIGLFLLADDYINLIENFDDISWHIRELDSSKQLGNVNYPLGLLDDKYEIHFMHYKSFEEAKNKFEKRAKRITTNKFFKWDGSKDFATDNQINRFDQATSKFKSVIFLSSDRNTLDLSNRIICGKDYQLDAVRNFYNNLPKFSFITLRRSNKYEYILKKLFLVRLSKKK